MIAFKFNEAVAEIRKDYPEESRDVTFIDTSSWFAKWRIVYALWRMEPQFLDALKNRTKKTSLPAIAALIVKHGFSSLRDPLSQYGLCVANSAYKGTMPLRNLQYAFDHEFGHLAVEGATQRKLFSLKSPEDITQPDEATALTNQWETKADVFAALRGLKRGTLERKDIETLSTNRALNTYFGYGTTHATTKGLDALLVTYEDAKVLSLTPEEIKTIAAQHGREFCLTGQEVSEIYCNLYQLPSLIKSGSPELCMQALLNVAGDHDTPASAKLATHILGEILHKGKIDFPVAVSFNVAGDNYDEMRGELAKIRKTTVSPKAGTP